MKLLLLTTTLCSGLVAGLMYAYSCSVNPGLKNLPDDAYIKAMQSIDTAIQQPLFFIIFMGLLLLFPVCAFRVYKPDLPSFYLIAAAMGIYFVGVMGVTVFGNIPLNEKLAGFSLNNTAAKEHAAMRKAFENPWNTFHSLRTVAAIGSFILTILSLLQQQNQRP